MEGTKVCYYFQDIIHGREPTERSEWRETIFKISVAESELRWGEASFIMCNLDLFLSLFSLKTRLAKKKIKIETKFSEAL